MGKSVKIRTLAPPAGPLAELDPGEYLSGLEFYETDSPIGEEDRDGLAQLTHFVGFMALQAHSSKWESSIVPRGSLAYKALESHFSHLGGWAELAADARGLNYHQLACFLMQHYPPHPPKR